MEGENKYKDVSLFTEIEYKIFEEFKKIVGNDNSCCPICKSIHFYPRVSLQFNPYQSGCVTMICNICGFMSHHMRFFFPSLPVLPKEEYRFLKPKLWDWIVKS